MLCLQLKKIRKKRHLTQSDLASLLGVSKSLICCYEKGTRTPTVDKLIKLADILSVDYSYLLGNLKFVYEEEIPYYRVTKEEIDK